MNNNKIKKIDEQGAKIAVAGAVDAGKSTMIGVLTSNELDDGRGLARSKILKLKHEQETGRTTNVTLNPLIFEDEQSRKTHSLVDLCGHEKYLKTTMFGLTGLFVDYAIVVVGANMGVTRMTKEHIGILLWAKIPFIVAITKLDMCPDNVYEATKEALKKILKIPIFNKQILFINKNEQTAKNEIGDYLTKMNSDHNIIPILSVSNKSGLNIDNLKTILRSLTPRKQWDKEKIEGSVLYIDTPFMIKGVGIVVSGTLKGEIISVNQKLYIGPHNGQFLPVKARSMHNNIREDVTELKDADVGCIAISFLKDSLQKNQIKKGMVVVSDTKFLKNVSNEFRAKITVLHHSTTIKNNYQPVIHCGPIRQVARMLIDDDGKVTLRTGDTHEVRFKFIYRSEYLEEGSTFFFRDGATKGFGQILKIINNKELIKN